MNLFEATREMHHACEAHPVGQRMFRGDVTRQEWADWLGAMQVLHRIVDRAVPDHMARDAALAADLAMLPPARPSRAALQFAVHLTATDCGGAAYVLHGAHRSGGRVLAPKMVKRGLPTAHTCYRDPDAAQAWVVEARARDEWTHVARQTFKCLLAVMDEIERNGQ